MNQQRSAIRSYHCLTKKWSPIFSEHRTPPETPFLATVRSDANVHQGDELRTFLGYGTDIPFRHIEDVVRFCRRAVSPYNNAYARRAAWLDDREWNSGAAAAGLTPKKFYRRYETPLTATKFCEHLKQEVSMHVSVYFIYTANGNSARLPQLHSFNG